MFYKLSIIKTFTLFAFLFNFFSIEAQPPCGSNPTAGDYCSTATPMCNLNSYCGKTSSSYTPYVSASDQTDEDNTPLGSVFCSTIENNSWFSFIASADTATFVIWPGNCSNGRGIELNVYSTNDCYNFTSVSNCYNPVNVSNGSLIATGLTVGQTYYIMIDGNSGDVCDYILFPSSGVATPPSITDNQIICSGHNVMIEITNGSGGYSWTSSPPDPSLSGQTTQSLISVHPTQTTTYTCNMSGGSINPNCSGLTTLSSTITVLPDNDSHCAQHITCDISATSDAPSVCPGGAINLSSSGIIGNAVFVNTFDEGTLGVDWASSSAVTFNNPCDISPPYGTKYLWMGDASTAPRDLTSLDFDVSNGGIISFWMRYAIQGNNTPCEGPNEKDEGVSLQYSTNAGATWNDIVYFRPDGIDTASNIWLGTSLSVVIGQTVFTNWIRKSYTIPSAAQTTTTRFRWIQLASTALTHDHWGLDSIMVVAALPQTTTWTSIPAGLNYVGPNPPTQNPLDSTYYIASISNGTISCDDTVFISMNSITANAGIDDTICKGSSTTLNASGGTYYLWNTSSAGLNDYNIQNPVASPTVTTTYTVAVSTENNCSGTDEITITVVEGPTAQINTHADENCGHSDGSALVTVTGGTGALNYSWNTNPIQYTANATNLPEGNYSVMVSDANSCSAIAFVSIANIPGPSATISDTINETCTSKNGGAVVTVSDGTVPYTYLWSCNPPQNTSNMTNVHSGNYTVTVYDKNNCTAINTITINDSPPPTVTIGNIVPEDCGLMNGSITAITNGGLAPYSYVWNSDPQQFTAIASNLPNGNYTVTVTDDNSCTAIAFETVPTINGIEVNITAESEYCNRSDGSVFVTATGGSGIYKSYTWNTDPPQDTPSLSNIPAGSYTVTVVDDQGCNSSATVSIENIPGPVAGFSVFPQEQVIIGSTILFQDNSSGNINSWFWDLGDGTTESATKFAHSYDTIGQYVISLVVEDKNRCKDTAVSIIEIIDIFTIYIPSAFTPNGDGINDFFFPQGVTIDPNNYDMTIFDRWGNLMYHTSELSGKWNGTKNNSEDPSKVLMDVYIYRIKAKEINGSAHEYIGWVCLIP